MRPLSSGFTTMMRPFGTAANHSKKKKGPQGVQPTSTTDDVISQNRYHHRRVRNHALTQGEFLGVLGHLNCLQSLDNQPNDATSTTPDAYSRQQPKSFGRALIPHFGTSHFFSRKKGNCRCCCCSRAATSPAQSPPSTSRKPGPSLPPYPVGREQDESHGHPVKRVRFSSDTKPGAPEFDERKDTLDKACRTRHPSSYKKTKRSDNRKGRPKVKRRSRTLQRRSSWEELMNTLKKDPARRRRHNLALSGDDFEQTIIPRLLMAN